MNSGPQRTAIGKPDAVMIPTMSLRLGDQLFVSPKAVVDQSLLAIRPAISFFVEGAVARCFAPLSSNNILITAYGTGGKQPNARQYTTALDTRSSNLRTRTLSRRQNAKPRAR